MQFKPFHFTCALFVRVLTLAVKDNVESLINKVNSKKKIWFVDLAQLKEWDQELLTAKSTEKILLNSNADIAVLLHYGIVSELHISANLVIKQQMALEVNNVQAKKNVHQGFNILLQDKNTPQVVDFAEIISKMLKQNKYQTKFFKFLGEYFIKALKYVQFEVSRDLIEKFLNYQ